MTDVVDVRRGNSPLIISIPHDGRQVPRAMISRMTQSARNLPDTDWHVARLYRFAQALDATIITANYSRYVVDLNRPADGQPLYPGQDETGVCPLTTFAEEPIYIRGLAPSTTEVAARVEQFWHPYHAALSAQIDEIRREQGFVLLWEAHSIASTVPRFFDGSLPHLNFGTNDGVTFPASILDQIVKCFDPAVYEIAKNGRFKGGYTTRHYANPGDHRYTLQLEIAQRSYMDEATGTFDKGRANLLSGQIQRSMEVALEALSRG